LQQEIVICWMNKLNDTMSTWNHRVIVTPDGDGVWMAIHEVYYNEKGNPSGYTKNAISIGGNNPKEIKWVLRHMKECLDKPWLWGGDRFPQEYKPEK
jgi:hypothetical protein